MLEKTKHVKSPLRYPGGKSRAVKHILELIPENINKLCSPFLGGGSLELSCANLGIQVKAYDGFEPLVNFWQHILNNPLSLASVIEKHYPLPKNKFYSLQRNYSVLNTDLEKAAAYYVLNRSSFSGTTFSGGMSQNHPRFTYKSMERVKTFEINKFSVELADFKDSIDLHKNDFLYLDPPYFTNKRLYGHRGDMHDNFDHSGLFNLLNKRNNWILSYNDCGWVRQVYNGYKIHEAKWTYSMNNSKTSSEVLILSKDLSKCENKFKRSGESF